MQLLLSNSDKKSGLSINLKNTCSEVLVTYTDICIQVCWFANMGWNCCIMWLLILGYWKYKNATNGHAVHFLGNKVQPHLILFDFRSFLNLFKNMSYRILDTHVIQGILAQSFFHVRFRGGNQDFVKI